jgi:hypothetical protein
MSITFHLPESVPSREVFLSSTDARFTPSDSLKFRSPRYHKLLDIVENRTNLTTDDLFTLIDEVHGAAFDVASFGSVNQFVREIIGPYAEKWQRRTLRIVDQMQELHQNLTTAWNFTGEVMRAFHDTIATSSAQMAKKITTLSDLLAEEPISSTRHRSIVVSFETDVGIDIVDIFFYVTILELFMVIIGLTGMRSERVRDRVFESRRR